MTMYGVPLFHSLATLINDITRTVDDLFIVRLSNIFREANDTADTLARVNLGQAEDFIVFESIPICVLSILKVGARGVLDL